MALTRYIYKDIQPEITETFSNLHVDNEKLISLFKGWGFDIVINGNISWNLTLVQNNGYAMGFNQPQAIQIKKPHRYVDQIIFKNIDKSIKQEQDTIDGDYILVTNETIYLTEISYRMDATNCYLWSIYGNGQYVDPTQQNINLLKNLRFQIDTNQLDPTNHALTTYVNPSISQKYQYNRNSKYGFGGYHGDFINLKADSDIIKPNDNIKGQYGCSSTAKGSHTIEKGQYWGTESNGKIIDVIVNNFNSLNNPLPSISFDSENDCYIINGNTYYFPHGTVFYLIKRTPGTIKMDRGFLRDPSNPTSYLNIHDDSIYPNPDYPAFPAHTPPAATIDTWEFPEVIENARFSVGCQNFSCKIFNYSNIPGNSWESLPQWLEERKVTDYRNDTFEILRTNLLQVPFSSTNFGTNFYTYEDFDSSFWSDNCKHLWLATWATQYSEDQTNKRKVLNINYAISRFDFLETISSRPEDWTSWHRYFEAAVRIGTEYRGMFNPKIYATRVATSNWDYELQLRVPGGILRPDEYFDLLGYEQNPITRALNTIVVNSGGSNGDTSNGFYYVFSKDLETITDRSWSTMTREEYGIFSYYVPQGTRTYHGNHQFSQSMVVYTSYSSDTAYVLIAVRDPISDRTL